MFQSLSLIYVWSCTVNVCNANCSCFLSIDSKNGRITLVKVWDLEDSSTTLPSSTSLIISCTDPGGLSSTTAITVNVQDVNDHAPVLLIDAGFSQPIAVIHFRS
jgi:hypothetical protein